MSEDWNNTSDQSSEQEGINNGTQGQKNVPSEAYLTARATSGTLAMASADSEVCRAMIKENCIDTIKSLIESESNELIYRGLAIISSMLTSESTDSKPSEDGNATDRNIEEPTTDDRYHAGRYLLEGGIIESIQKLTTVKLDANVIQLTKQVARELSMVIQEPIKKQ